MVISSVVLGIGASSRSDVKRLCFSYARPGLGGGGGGSLGFDRGLLVLVGGFGLPEDIDNVLALMVGRRRDVSEAE